MSPLFKILSVSILSIPFLFNSCKKDNSPEEPGKGPEINIMSPAAGITVDTGDVVNILANIKHTAELHQYGYRLINEKNGSIVAEMTTHSHGNEILLDDNWINKMNGTFDLKLEVQAIDHEGNKSVKEVRFHCK